MGTAIASNPSASVPSMMEGWNETRAAYRLFAESDVTHSQLIKPHTVKTKNLSATIQTSVVLFIQDTTGVAPKAETGSIWVSVGDGGSDIFSYLRKAKELNWHCLLRVTQNRVITKPDGTKGYLKTFARALEAMAQKKIILRGRDGEAKREVNLSVAWSKICIQPPATGSELDFSTQSFEKCW